MLSRKVSPCKLTGVCAVSSASTKEGWLSDDAWREGVSTGATAGAGACTGAGAGADGPLRLTLLSGLEKFNEGFGKCVPPIETSELTEGDLPLYSNPGDIRVGDVESPLAFDIFLCIPKVGARVVKSSSELSDNDLGLGVLCA